MFPSIPMRGVNRPMSVMPTKPSTSLSAESSSPLVYRPAMYGLKALLNASSTPANAA